MKNANIPPRVDSGGQMGQAKTDQVVTNCDGALGARLAGPHSWEAPYLRPSR